MRDFRGFFWFKDVQVQTVRFALSFFFFLIYNFYLNLGLIQSQFRPELVGFVWLIRSDSTRIGTIWHKSARIGAYLEMKKKIPTRHQCAGSSVVHCTPRRTRVRHPYSRISAFQFPRAKRKGNPHARDQSNKVLANKAKSLSLGSTKFSKIRLFCSLQIIHIAQFDTKFQIYDECLPNQFLQPANKLLNLLGKTQVTTNDLKAKLHYLDTTPQCNQR